MTKTYAQIKEFIVSVFLGSLLVSMTLMIGYSIITTLQNTEELCKKCMVENYKSYPEESFHVFCSNETHYAKCNETCYCKVIVGMT